jgi:hypothetical protein
MKHSIAAKFFAVLVTTILFWTIALGVYCTHQSQVTKRKGQEKYRITSIASISRSADTLPHNILTSLLNLSDTSFLYDQRVDHWDRLLTRCPAILHSRTWFMPPQTLGIEYQLRQPIALVGGVKNVAIDEHGVVFFMTPFFSVKRLPVLNVNLGAFENLRPLQRAIAQSKEALIGVYLIKEMTCLSTKLHLTLALVDMCSWSETNFFRKEVVLGFSHPSSIEKILYVRIHPKTLRESLHLLETVLPKLVTASFHGGVLDMRFDGRLLCSGEILS